MTGFSGVQASLQSANFIQLGLAFSAIISYMLAQGRLVGAVGRRMAWAAALLSAAGFCVAGDDWMHATMLVAFGLVAIGLFAALVSALSRLLFGVEHQPAMLANSALGAEAADAAASVIPPQHPASSNQPVPLT